MKTDRCKTGFTLVELLIAVAVVVILISITIVAGNSLRAQAEERLAAGTISILVSALEQYYEFYDQFPDPVPPDALYNQLHSTPDSRRIIEQINASLIAGGQFIDPWDNPLRYDYTPDDNFPRITSDGLDGKFETADDMTSKGM